MQGKFWAKTTAGAGGSPHFFANTNPKKCSTDPRAAITDRLPENGNKKGQPRTAGPGSKEYRRLISLLFDLLVVLFQIFLVLVALFAGLALFMGGHAALVRAFLAFGFSFLAARLLL